jgi:hypothetical protein
MPNYIEIIGERFPGTQAYTAGDPANYNDIVWITAPIAKATLDGITWTSYGINDLVASSNDAESSSTSTSWLRKVTLTTPILQGGVQYRIGWSAEIKGTSTTQKTKVQLQLDNSIIFAANEITAKASTDYVTISGFYYYTGTGISLNVGMDYCSSNPSNTAYIRRARLEIWRVG